MKKEIKLLILVIISVLTIGCTSITPGNTGVIKSPTNNSLNIYGKWRIESIDVFDKEINVLENIEAIKGKEIEFSKNKIDYIDTIYENPRYKLKVVNKDYILSYEWNIVTEPFMDGKDKIDVISIISNNNIISEFILQEENKGYMIYMGALIEVYKVSGDSQSDSNKSIDMDLIEGNVAVDNIDYYNTEIGVMLALKKPRRVNEDGTFTSEKYRTLWISFKNDKLMPVIEKKNIIFPRMDGIWSLKSSIIENGKYNVEYFAVKSTESKTSDDENEKDENIVFTSEADLNKINSYTDIIYNKTSNYEIKNVEDIYKNITFIGNNYIGIEKYSGENFENIFDKYQVVPIDNINSSTGLKIEELYSKDMNLKYKMEYERALRDAKIVAPSNIDYSNFTIKRKDGKWELVGTLGELDGLNGEYLLNLRPNSKMLNYDSLVIPWKVLKGDIPSIRDAYISPNQRIAIILFEDNLAIYEIKDKMLKGAPLVNIDIDNEQVIMAEWSTGAYVEKWSKSFSDGIDITN